MAKVPPLFCSRWPSEIAKKSLFCSRWPRIAILCALDFFIVFCWRGAQGAPDGASTNNEQRTTSAEQQKSKSKNELISDLWSLKLFTCQLPELRGADFGAGAVVPVGANLVFAWEVIGNYGSG